MFRRSRPVALLMFSVLARNRFLLLREFISFSSRMDKSSEVFKTSGQDQVRVKKLELGEKEGFSRDDPTRK